MVFRLQVVAVVAGRKEGRMLALLFCFCFAGLAAAGVAVVVVAVENQPAKGE